jgi:hypothetical protein
VLRTGRLIALDTAVALKRTHGGARTVSATYDSTLVPSPRGELTRALELRGALLLEPEKPAAAATTIAFRARGAEEILP